MAAHGIDPIDLLVVNLYPFEATVAKEGCTSRSRRALRSAFHSIASSPSSEPM